MDEVLKDFQEAIKKGELSSEAATVNGYPATKNFRNYSQEMIKITEFAERLTILNLIVKLLMIRTDADTYNNVLNENVLRTLKMD